MARSKTSKTPRGLRQQQRLAQLNSDAFEVAGRRLLSLPGKSAAQGNRLWAAWGWEKIVAAQRAGWEASWALWSSAFAPWTPKTANRVVQASLRPVERKVRSNRARLRSGR